MLNFSSITSIISLFLVAYTLWRLVRLENKLRVEGYIDQDRGQPKEDDPLLPEALELINKQDKVSASLLQRRLPTGYARAAYLLDQLHDKGFISESSGSRPRVVYHGKITQYLEQNKS